MLEILQGAINHVPLEAVSTAMNATGLWPWRRTFNLCKKLAFIEGIKVIVAISIAGVEMEFTCKVTLRLILRKTITAIPNG